MAPDGLQKPVAKRRSAAVAVCKVAVFDLGGVLIQWDPRLLYRKLLPTEDAVERFLSTVCTPEWNAEQDAGRPLEAGIAELVLRFPEHAVLIEAWRERFPEMMLPIRGSIELLRELRERAVPLYALSNWGVESFEVTRGLFPFLEWFQGILISGRVGVVKPDPEIFGLLVREHGLNPAEVAFIDDQPLNVEAAHRLGFQSVLFSSPEELRSQLARLGLFSG
jgi:2-haloacid dehalogenase